MTQKELHPATRIVWTLEIPNPENSGEPIIFKKIRRSPTYLELARYLIANPPNKKPFKPRDLGRMAYALQTYKADVETWVAMKMCESIQDSPEFTDGALLKQVLRELRHLQWDTDSKERGFYLIQPMAKTELATESRWQLEAIGYDSIRTIKARYPKDKDGKSLVGYWHEPEPDEYEEWNARIAIMHLKNVTIQFAEASLTGQTIGQLKPRQMLRMVEGAMETVKKALPPAKEKGSQLA